MGFLGTSGGGNDKEESSREGRGDAEKEKEEREGLMPSRCLKSVGYLNTSNDRTEKRWNLLVLERLIDAALTDIRSVL